MQQTELVLLKSNFQLFVNNGLQILCNKEFSNINWYLSWSITFLISSYSTRKSGYNMYRGWTQTDYQNRYYNINQMDEET